jgi:hypothetical protein
MSALFTFPAVFAPAPVEGMAIPDAEDTQMLGNAEPGAFLVQPALEQSKDADAAKQFVSAESDNSYEGKCRISQSCRSDVVSEGQHAASANLCVAGFAGSDASGSDSDSDSELSSDEDGSDGQQPADNNQRSSDGSGQLSGQKRKATPEQRKERAERKRTRNNLFKPVRKNQRCGKCQTCMNPRMKKACLTVRAKQEEELRRRGHLPASQQQQQRQPAGTAAPAADDEVQRLQALLDRYGKLESSRVSDFVRQLSETKPRMYKVYLTIITVSGIEALKRLAHSEALSILRDWLIAAQEKQKFQRILDIVDALAFIPVDREALQRSGIGKTLTEIRKKCKDEQQVQTKASQLIAKWKEAVGVGGDR